MKSLSTGIYSRKGSTEEKQPAGGPEDTICHEVTWRRREEDGRKREDCRGEEKFSTFLGPLAGSENLTDKNRLTGEKHAHLFHIRFM